jgi:TIR domain
MPVKIFFCYAREDEELLNKLKSHLRPLQREGLIDVWYDREISAGTEWEQEIKQHLNNAQIILLLVSPDFMNSDYCYSVEMKRALERHNRKEAKVIPIILRPVYWHGEPLGKLQALPTDGKPVRSPYWHDLDSAFYNVVMGIRKVVKVLATQHPTTLPAIKKEEQKERASSAAPTPTILQANETPSPASSFAVEKLTLIRTLGSSAHLVKDELAYFASRS